MKNRVEFERALLDRVVKSLRPDFAAVVCGPEDSLVFSANSTQPDRKPDPGIVERALELKEPVSDSTERRGTLAVPYLDESDNVEGVMYIEVDAPRRLKKIDLAILERLREQIEARLKVSQRKGSTRESEAGAQKVTEATLDIILRVIKPPRAVVVAMVEGKLKALDARVPGGEKFSAKKSLDFGLLKSLMERGEPTHLTDALAPETLELLNLSEVRGDSRSVACTPLRNEKHEVRGLVFLDSPSEVGLFDGTELAILERLARSLESELAWVLNEDGEFLHEPAEDPAGEYRSKFGGDTIDAAELYPVSQLLALTTYPEETAEPEPPPEPESLSIEIERGEQSDLTDFESDWPEFEALNDWPNEQDAERESDSLEVVTLEREMETTEDNVPVVLADPAEEGLWEEEEDGPFGDLFEEESPEEDEETSDILLKAESPEEDDASELLPEAESPEEDDGQAEDGGHDVPALEDVFALRDEPSFFLESTDTELPPDSRLEKSRSSSTDSAEILFQTGQVPADVAEMSAEVERTREADTSEPELLTDLMTSAKPLAPKKALAEDDILRSLLQEEKPGDAASGEGLGEPFDYHDEDPEPKSAGKASEAEASAGLANHEPRRKGTREKKPSFVKRAWRFIWPFGRKDGGYLTPVTICGEIFLDGNVTNDDPVEVVFFFPDQKMRVTIKLSDEETEYFFSGNFSGEEPPRVSLRAQKKGYFPAKISRIKLHHSEDGFHAELNPIELLSREI